MLAGSSENLRPWARPVPAQHGGRGVRRAFFSMTSALAGGPLGHEVISLLAERTG